MTPKLKALSLWLAPLMAAVISLLMIQSGWTREAALTGGLTTLCALWWIFEPIPIPATSLIPLGVFPLLGILDGKQVAQAYGDPLIMLADGWRHAIQGHGKKRCAPASGACIWSISLAAMISGRLVFGFMVASAVLSMWVSNTATTLMLLPVAYAVLGKRQLNGGCQKAGGATVSGYCLRREYRWLRHAHRLTAQCDLP